MLKSAAYFSIFLFLWACAPNQADDKFEKSPILKEASYHLLIFQKEQKAELWEVSEKNSLLDSFLFKKLPQLPIGEFDLNFDEKNQRLEIQFPNVFYKSKAYKNEAFQALSLGSDMLPATFFQRPEIAKISKTIIFPNDNRRDGELRPCFACPHWMAEIYAFLNLKKKDYF